MKALAVVAFLIIGSGAALVFIANKNTPSRAEELTQFLGVVEILESDSGREGLDGYYWARLRCDPVKVRNHLAKHAYKTYSSKTQRLQEYYLNPPFTWPKDVEIFNHDWIAYTITPGFYRVVAFPSDDRNEIFFLEYDT